MHLNARLAAGSRLETGTTQFLRIQSESMLLRSYSRWSETCLCKVDYSGGVLPTYTQRPTNFCCFEATGGKLLSDLKWQRGLAHSHKECTKCAESTDFIQEAFCGPHSTPQKSTLQTQDFLSLLAQTGSPLLLLNEHYTAHHFPTLIWSLCHTHKTFSCWHAC